METLKTKELLYYLLFTEGDEKLAKDQENFKRELELSEETYSELKMSALSTRNLISYIDRHEESIETRNDEVLDILAKAVEETSVILGEKFSSYETWMENWWEEEKNYEREDEAIDLASAGDKKSKVHVYATQFNADTSNEVALPDKYVKFATRGWTSDIPKAKRQYYNKKFTVNVTYKDKTKKSIPVNDVGPWNTNDNYWDSKSAANPRRKFTDLERFVPEAWAAFKKDYNNGKDGSGRVVTNPAGIDLCLTVAKSLGFAANASHWVYVDMSDLP